MSPDEKYIAVWNGVDGVDLYPLSADSRPVRHYHYAPTFDIGKTLSMSISFVHQGRAVVCGSPRGSVSIWDQATEELLQTLEHDGTIPTLSFVYNVPSLIEFSQAKLSKQFRCAKDS